jgi:peroxiredoxin
MKKNQNTLWLTLVCLLLMCSMEVYSQSTSISGKINSPDPKAQVLLVKWDLNEGTHQISDTVEIDQDGKFSFKVQMTEPEVYLLSAYRKQNIMLVLEPNQTIDLTLDGETGGQATVSGSEDTDLLLKFQQKQMMLQEQQLRPIVEQYRAAQEAKDEAKLAEVAALYEAKEAEINKIMHEYILKEMSNSIASYVAFPEWKSDEELALMRKLTANVEEKRPDLALTKATQAKIDRIARFAIGAVAPDIAEVNPEGEKISLSSMQGKYVLVDFWASWCGPCRQENPNIVRVFEKYKDKGFTVFGVSLDKSKDKWVEAIAKDNLNWTHISDLNGWQAAPAVVYGIRSIPASFLLDKEGRIIAKDLRGEALEAKIAELFADDSGK